jgi:GNAT superfamily N-acetyltransferase
MTADTAGFLAAAGDFLRADPARNTVMLSVTEDLLLQAPASGETLFGWWQPDGDQVRAVFMHTPDYPLLLSRVSGPAAAALARDLTAASGGLGGDQGFVPPQEGSGGMGPPGRERASRVPGTARRVLGVNAGQEAADAFAAAWRDRTGDAVAVYRRMRLFRLGELIPPRPWPEGTARLAAGTERDLLARWFGAFAREVGDPPGQDHSKAAAGRLAYGGLTVWEAGGVPVSVAGRTRAAAGMVRVGPVYTPPELRGRGYAGAATAAVSQAALDAGLREVVLYTDLANPTSNALYRRLGYRPVEDRVVLSFTRAARVTLHS